MSARPVRMHPEVIDSDRALEDVIRRLERTLRKAARRLSKGDRALADDLYQEALIYLWQLDPSRFAAGEIGYLRKAAVGRMMRQARRDAATRQRLPITVRL
jgi:DNA-directed RNA polymerase specialized sigma24 family protein